jgi:alkylation response protein AidB-like acyl-CoA dehydrogenase
MDLTFNEREIAFRDELRGWLAANAPEAHPYDEDEDAQYARARDWQRKLADAGWAGVHWPVEYGGRGATLTESAIFFEELGRATAPLPPTCSGLLLAGPTIMVWGTDAQKERLLNPILTAEEIWCQGFSEPEAGSDLASLKTRAVKDGDEWVVTGPEGVDVGRAVLEVVHARRAHRHRGRQAQGPDVLRARHGPGRGAGPPAAPDHRQRRVQRALHREARIPDDMVIGGVGNGWKVALTTLMNERAGLAFFLQVRMRNLLDQLIEEAAQRGLLDDPVIADKLGELHIRTEILRLTAYRGLTATEKYGQPGPEGSVTKWMWSEGNQLLVQAAADILGPEALTAGRRGPTSCCARAATRSRAARPRS